MINTEKLKKYIGQRKAHLNRELSEKPTAFSTLTTMKLEELEALEKEIDKGVFTQKYMLSENQKWK